MAGLPVHTRRTLLPLPVLALASLLAPGIASAASTPDLATEVTAASAQLRQAWAADPSTALPYPGVRLLPAGASVDLIR